MNCPGCKEKISFLESLTIINPLYFKCKKCSNYITLSRSSIKIYISILVVIFVISLAGFLTLGTDKIFTGPFLVIFIPAVLIAVTVIHYFFWEKATGELRVPDGDYTSGLSC